MHSPSDTQNETAPPFPDTLAPWRDDGVLHVNEIFYSIEGEGGRIGEPTTFVRLAHCNLRCAFCDTRFQHFRLMSVAAIRAAVREHPARWVCITGGEPLGQHIAPLARQLLQCGYRLHIETNGTISPPAELFELIEYWTVSPKRYPVASGYRRITELKYVVGECFSAAHVQAELAERVYLQPESLQPRYVDKALRILRLHPDWRLSCRLHQLLDLP